MRTLTLTVSLVALLALLVGGLVGCTNDIDITTPGCTASAKAGGGGGGGAGSEGGGGEGASGGGSEAASGCTEGRVRTGSIE